LNTRTVAYLIRGITYDQITGSELTKNLSQFEQPRLALKPETEK